MTSMKSRLFIDTFSFFDRLGAVLAVAAGEV